MCQQKQDETNPDWWGLENAIPTVTRRFFSTQEWEDLRSDDIFRQVTTSSGKTGGRDRGGSEV